MKPVLPYPYYSYRATTFRLRLPTGEQLMVLKCYSPNFTPVVHDNLYMYIPASNFNTLIYMQTLITGTMGSSRARLGAVVSKVKTICLYLPKGRVISRVVTLGYECKTKIRDSVNLAAM